MRSPLPLAIISVAAVGLWYVLARREQSLGSDLESAWDALNRHSKWVAGIALVGVFTTGVFATRSAAGADASGYISEAAMLMSGRLHHPDELSDIRHDYDSHLTSPLGWRPTGESAQSPTYPPGLPLLMAIPHSVAGVTGASAVVIIAAGIAVLATGLLAFRIGGSIAAIIAASLDRKSTRLNSSH